MFAVIYRVKVESLTAGLFVAVSHCHSTVAAALRVTMAGNVKGKKNTAADTAGWC